MPPHILPVVLLPVSTLFMTPAGCGHLQFQAAPLLLVIFASRGAAFAGFSVGVLKEPGGPDHAAGFGPVAPGAWFIFQGRSRPCSKSGRRSPVGSAGRRRLSR